MKSVKSGSGSEGKYDDGKSNALRSLPLSRTMRHPASSGAKSSLCGSSETESARPQRRRLPPILSLRTNSAVRAIHVKPQTLTFANAGEVIDGIDGTAVHSARSRDNAEWSGAGAAVFADRFLQEIYAHAERGIDRNFAHMI